MEKRDTELTKSDFSVISQFVKRFREAPPESSSDRKPLLSKESFWWIPANPENAQLSPKLDKSFDIGSTISSIKVNQSSDKASYSSVLNSLDTDEQVDWDWAKIEGIMAKADLYIEKQGIKTSIDSTVDLVSDNEIEAKSHSFVEREEDIIGGVERDSLDAKPSENIEVHPNNLPSLQLQLQFEDVRLSTMSGITVEDAIVSIPVVVANPPIGDISIENCQMSSTQESSRIWDISDSEDEHEDRFLITEPKILALENPIAEANKIPDDWNVIDASNCVDIDVMKEAKISDDVKPVVIDDLVKPFLESDPEIALLWERLCAVRNLIVTHTTQ